MNDELELARDIFQDATSAKLADKGFDASELDRELEFLHPLPETQALDIFLEAEFPDQLHDPARVWVIRRAGLASEKHGQMRNFSTKNRRGFYH